MSKKTHASGLIIFWHMILLLYLNCHNLFLRRLITDTRQTARVNDYLIDDFTAKPQCNGTYFWLWHCCSSTCYLLFINMLYMWNTFEFWHNLLIIIMLNMCLYYPRTILNKTKLIRIEFVNILEYNLTL